jgi:hypothetical protein
MSQTIEAKYAIGQRVTIGLSGRPGRVSGIWLDKKDPIRYNVEYVDNNGLISSHYFCEDEIE